LKGDFEIRMDTKLLVEIKQVLNKFPEYWEGEMLLKHKLIDDLRGYKKDLLEKLLSNELIKNTYSIKLETGIVFKVDEFISMLRYKNYWDNSYTRYSNEIGLSSDDKYLKYNSDVVLDFPHKDCILEGGMTKDEVGKKEIYYHKILAKEEIDTLLTPKIFTNIKKYDKNGENVVTQFNDTDNLIIKGNNLISLHSLKERYAGKIKMIYIDPPFNTGGDSFKYNDRFNHSTWLTFMKNRLEVAKELLSNDGTIYVHLDYNEVHYLKVLMDEIFGRENFLNEIIWAYRERETSKRFYNRKHDTILFYAKDVKSNYTFNYDSIREQYSNVTIAKFKYTDENGRKYRLRTKDGKSDPPIEDENTYRQYLDEQSGPLPRDWFIMPFLNQAADERVGFNTQKPESLIAKFIKASTNENDIVLDFFSGSGTTLAVAQKLNRRYIGIEQMDYIKSTTLPRMIKVIGGDDTGISSEANWTGGGSFVYAELYPINQKYIAQIQKANSDVEIQDIVDKIKESAFLDFKINIDKITNKNSGFASLTLEEKKSVLIQVLDANQLYLSYSEMDDEQYGIPEPVKQFNHSFYNKRKDVKRHE